MPAISAVSNNTQIEILVPGVQGAFAAGGGTAASLGAAADAGVGARAFVTDAMDTTHGSLLAGGGTGAVPVYSDGADWRIG